MHLLFSRISIYLLLFSSLAPYMQATAQERKTIIAFRYLTHDFGSIKEDGGPVSYDFTFTNEGNAPLVIKNVQAACGCTVPEWPQTPIYPGGEGKITVVFNPANKPGPFTKSLTVYSNSPSEATIINVTGKVVPRPRKPSDHYPDVIGNFRMISRYMNIGEITTEKPLRKEFIVYNNSDSVVSIQKLNYSTVGFMKVTVEPMQIPAKDKASIFIDYDPIIRNDFGYLHDKLELVTNDNKEPVKQLFVAAVISKYFPPMTSEEKANAPKMKADRLLHEFGLIKQGDKPVTSFTIKNEGKSPLVIYKVKPSCGCTITELDRKTVAPGESATLRLTFDTSAKEGMQEKHINLYSNDPANFNMVISLKAKIEKQAPAPAGK